MVSLFLPDYFFTDLNQHLTLNALFDKLKLFYFVIDDLSLNKAELNEVGGKNGYTGFLYLSNTEGYKRTS